MTTTRKRRRGTAIMLDDWQGGTGVLVLADGGHHWLLPGGGAEAGETRMEAVIREVREETGMRASSAIALFTHEGVATAEMVLPLVEAATHWLQLGLPVEQLNIVAYSAQSAAELMGAFGVLKRQYERARPA